MKNTKASTKKYGKPYGRKHLLRRGDMKEIAKKSDYSVDSVRKQLAGYRTLHTIVKEVADAVADKNETFIKSAKSEIINN